VHVGGFAEREKLATRGRGFVTVQEVRPLRVGSAAVAGLASRLGERDRLVALACYEHRVLTTEQLRRLHFGSSRRCRDRLGQLYQLRVLDHFRPYLQPGQGSAPYHWILDEAGAHVVAACLDLDRSELRWRHQTAIANSRSHKLDHQLEVNEFFTRLSEESDARGGRLANWWSERRITGLLDGRVAPDGYGKLLLPDRRPVSFLLELDRGTEDHERLRQKLRRYAKALPRSPLADTDPLVVVAVPSQARRDNLAHTLASAAVPHRLITWTPDQSPLDALSNSLDLAPLPAPHP
jgi:protein involved in plasmid replication-relaxation